MPWHYVGMEGGLSPHNYPQPMTSSDMARRAHANRAPEERTALAKKASAAFRAKYGADKMKLVRAGKKLKPDSSNQ